MMTQTIISNGVLPPCSVNKWKYGRMWFDVVDVRGFHQSLPRLLPGQLLDRVYTPHIGFDDGKGQGGASYVAVIVEGEITQINLVSFGAMSDGSPAYKTKPHVTVTEPPYNLADALKYRRFTKPPAHLGIEPKIK